MNKKRIEGQHGAPRGHNTPKATGVPVEVNAAAVRRSKVPLPGEICPEKFWQKSVEVIVPRSRTGGLEYARLNWATRQCDPGKDRTDKGQSDRVEDSEAIATDRWCAELRASAMGSMGLPGQVDSACSHSALVAGSDRNRRIRSRMSGGVGPVVG